MVVDIETIQLIEQAIENKYQAQVNDLLKVIGELRGELENQKNELEETKKQLENQTQVETVGPVNSAEIDGIKQEIENLKEIIKNVKATEEQFDLKKGDFENMFTKSKLSLDTKSEAPTAAILNAVFKNQLKKDPNNPGGIKNYDFSPRVINQTLSLVQWITAPTGVFEVKDKNGKMLTGYPKDNTFDTAKPIEKQVSLGTGTGKSTLFLRCLAHCNPEGGATLVVPYSSLINSVITAHEKWLSKDDPNVPDDKKDERAIKCPICEGRHTNYETVHNGPSKMINVFTWWEFLDAYLNHPEWIKPWVVFDEGHTDTPAYQALISGLKSKKGRPFKIVEMSATFGNLPTSRKLSGTIADYYVTDFEKVFAKNPEVFNKTVIVFVDDISKLNLKPLNDNKIKYIILNDSIKDYATDIVRSIEPPLIVFANRDYSVGFSFGDVNVVSTGISCRYIIDESGKLIKKEGVSDFADLLQERGRGARDPKHSATWISLISTNGDYKGKLKDDYAGTVLENFFKKPKPDDNDKKEVKKVINLFSKSVAIPKLSEEEGNLNLNRVLVRSLKDNLDPTSLFTIKPSEKGKRETGQFIFINNLLKYFREEQLRDLIIEATKEKIEPIVKDYEWFETPEEEDDYVFNTEAETRIVGFYLQARDKHDANIVKTKDEIKLIITFQRYKFDKKSLTV